MYSYRSPISICNFPERAYLIMGRLIGGPTLGGASQASFLREWWVQRRAQASVLGRRTPRSREERDEVVISLGAPPQSVRVREERLVSDSSAVFREGLLLLGHLIAPNGLVLM